MLPAKDFLEIKILVTSDPVMSLMRSVEGIARSHKGTDYVIQTLDMFDREQMG